MSVFHGFADTLPMLRNKLSEQWASKASFKLPALGEGYLGSDAVIGANNAVHAQITIRATHVIRTTCSHVVRVITHQSHPHSCWQYADCSGASAMRRTARTNSATGTRGAHMYLICGNNCVLTWSQACLKIRTCALTMRVPWGHFVIWVSSQCYRGS